MTARERIPVEEAMRRVQSAVALDLEPEEVALEDALYRVLARDAVALSSVPPFACSRVDGYGVAVGADRSDVGCRAYRVTSCLYAGTEQVQTVGPGEAVRIMTGAPIPPGVEAVVPFEEAQGAAWPASRVAAPDQGPETVEFGAIPEDGLNVIPRGSQAARGQILYRRGETIDAEAIGRLASAGVLWVPVRRRARLGILTTGTELSPLGEPLPPGKIFNSNVSLFSALARTWFAEPVPGDPVTDDARAIAAALQGLLARTDCVVATGGVAGGDRDLMREALSLLGTDVLVEEVDVYPGGRLVVGRKDGHLIFGLSGSPGAAMATATLFLRPVLFHLAGRAWPAPLPARLRLAERIPLSPRRAVPVRLAWTESELVASPVPRHEWLGDALPGRAGFWLTPAVGGECVDGVVVEVHPVEDL